MAKATRTPVHLSLTLWEIRRLEKQAAEELRSVTNYVTRLLVAHLRRPRRSNGPVAKMADRRREYAVQVWLTPAQRRALHAQAERDMRNVGNYVTAVLLERLRKG